MYEMTPGRLAKELGVPKFEMWQTMQQLRINAKRMDARLSDSQDSTLRRYFANKRKDREARRPVLVTSAPHSSGARAGRA